MKKKTSSTASGTSKRRKSAVAGRKAAPPRVRLRKARPASPSGQPVASNDARSTVRRLRTELAQAQKRIDELQGHADTIFPLDILNRARFRARTQSLYRLYQTLSCRRRAHRARCRSLEADQRRVRACGRRRSAEGGRGRVAATGALFRCDWPAGGDEFALLLWHLSETDAHAKAAALEQAIDRLRFVFRGRTATAGVSAGVALLGTHAESGKALEEADRAMYVRKAQRRHEA